jgi:hypothetical protein
MLQKVLGAIFPQVGILAKSLLTGVDASISITGTGVTGSLVSTNAVNDGSQMNGMVLVPCTVLSPISNSNLVFVRETITAPNLLGISIFSSLAVFG